MLVLMFCQYCSILIIVLEPSTVAMVTVPLQVDTIGAIYGGQTLSNPHKFNPGYNDKTTAVYKTIQISYMGKIPTINHSSCLL